MLAHGLFGRLTSDNNSVIMKEMTYRRTSISSSVRTWSNSSTSDVKVRFEEDFVKECFRFRSMFSVTTPEVNELDGGAIN
mmetsp:Transcript_58986/g.144312  ORF Transcript_58986/g.144312 Transcript_58986/m.144312 type:complete len:80 (-) Transcript_58986:1016-1255(-)